MVTGLAAVGCLIASTYGDPHTHAPAHDKALAYGAATGFLVFGAIAVRSVASELERVVGGRTGPGHAGVLRWLVLLIGYLILGFAFLELIEVRAIHEVLVGGALTGIILGIAAQNSLGNLFAGVVLLIARPFNIGDRIRIRSGAMGGEIVGTVTGMGLTYVTMVTADGPLSLPNGGVLAAAIGPAAEPQPAPEP